MDGDRTREVLAAGGPVPTPGGSDALSAPVAPAAGNQALSRSGHVTAAALLRVPDVGYLTPAEMAGAARRVCGRVPGAAVVVDGDTGHGDALDTIGTAPLLEAAGAAGRFLEATYRAPSSGLSPPLAPRRPASG